MQVVLMRVRQLVQILIVDVRRLPPIPNHVVRVDRFPSIEQPPRGEHVGVLHSLKFDC